MWAILVGAFLPDLLWIALARIGAEPAQQFNFFDDWSHSLLSVVIMASGFSLLFVRAGKDTDGKPSRWIFSDIAPDSFRWRAVISDANGATWKLREEMWAHRFSAGSK